jgi:hypothetical protein
MKKANLKKFVSTEIMLNPVVKLVAVPEGTKVLGDKDDFIFNGEAKNISESLAKKHCRIADENAPAFQFVNYIWYTFNRYVWEQFPNEIPPDKPSCFDTALESLHTALQMIGNPKHVLIIKIY